VKGDFKMKIGRFKGVGRFLRICLILLYMFICAGAAPAQEPRRISMDFQEAALKDVLKVFSQQAGLNFVAAENIEDKRITLYLEGVEVKDAMDSILKANNLAYDQAPGSNVFVVRESKAAKVNMITKVYTLSFARISDETSGEDGTTSASDIKSVLESLLTKDESGEIYGSIVVDKRTNSIIITSIPEDFELVEETIKKLDSMTPQALIEAEIVEIRTSALKKMGLEWGGSDGTFVRFTGPTKITHFPFIRNKNPFSRSLLGSTSSTTTTTTETATVTETTSQDPTLATLSLAEFSVVLKALETEGTAKYLAKPRIMALSNETAEIKITADTTIGVKKTSVTDTGEVIEEAERTETGVMLKVTPTINKEGYITMTIEPEVSRAVQSPQFINFADPTKRSAKTTVMVKNGQTIAIGGLLKSDDEKSKRGTPFLSKVPFLGNLFQSNNNTTFDTELIVFITAHSIMDSEEMSKTKTFIKQEEQTPKITLKKQSPLISEPADSRESQIRKTVMRLRKKRQLSRE
jgi:type IV pilus secretin PilQ/predicted competence protein